MVKSNHHCLDHETLCASAPLAFNLTFPQGLLLLQCAKHNSMKVTMSRVYNVFLFVGYSCS